MKPIAPAVSARSTRRRRAAMRLGVVASGVAGAAGWLGWCPAALVGLAALALELHLSRRRLGHDLVAAVMLRDRLAAAIEALPHGFALYDPDDRLVLCNARYRELYALSAPAMVPGASFKDILRYGLERGQYADVREPDAWLEQRLAAHRRGQAIDQRLGDGRRLRVTEQPMADGSVVGIRIDVTESKLVEEALRAGEERFRAMADVALEAILIVDSEDRVRFWSKGAVRLFGWSEAEMLGEALDRIVPEPMRAMHRAGLRRYVATGEARLIGRTLELTAVRRDGTEFPMELSLSSWRQGDGTYFGTIIRDISDRKQAEARIAQLAFYDPLTGLPNRVLLQERLAGAVAAATRDGTVTAVMCLDLDHFKEINDTRGHAAGDAVLQIAAERLRGCVRDADTVGRLGGDEFAVLQVGIGGVADVQALCERLLESFGPPFMLDGQAAHIGLSIGVAIAPLDSSSAGDLLRCADLALYRAKGEGRGVYRMFEPVMDAQLRVRKQLEQELREALERGDQLRLDYQPQVDLASGRIVSAEALVRWQHPGRGLLAPGVFVPLAEQTGLIGQLGAWVLRQACREAARWPDAIGVSVNLSPVQMRQRKLAEEVALVLRETGLPAARLELEITEGVLLQDDAQALSLLDALKQLGVQIALDDFGTGYSSLNYLRRFAFDRIKIDQSFVRDLEAGGDSAAIIRAVISLGRGLAVGITAEGVETEAQLAFLSAEGCGTAQGYHLGRPMGPERLADLLSGQPLGAPPLPALARGLAEHGRAWPGEPGAGLAAELGLQPGSIWLEPGGPGPSSAHTVPATASTWRRHPRRGIQAMSAKARLC